MPSSEYSATDVVQLVCEGLKNNDVPKADNGVERYYNFLTPQGRVALAPPPPKNGTQGGVTLDFFVANAGSPAFGALVSCTSFRLLGDARITPGSIARGSLCTQMIEVRVFGFFDIGSHYIFIEMDFWQRRVQRHAAEN